MNRNEFLLYMSGIILGHVFTGTNHLFRFNTSFYSGITHNGQCFYSLNYDDVDNQILSELRCRSNKPNHQVCGAIYLYVSPPKVELLFFFFTSDIFTRHHES